ncbi:hypothetical protein [Xenophilus azovorans]|uniref:hypothetical protein n=1 Tax=Xenophilus azovorans TaxID=151755 RepID=UPI0005702057|nr:hypothetical protein [Xenophilus azovorans]
MVEDSPLDLIRQRTALLVAQQLRSHALVIARLADLIQQAVRWGHPHRAIHDAMTAGGLAVSWNTYRVSLRRARSRDGKTQTDPAAGAPSGAARLSGAPQVEVCALRAAPEPVQGSGTSSTTDMLAALERARVTASKDYARIAREDYRRRGRAIASTATPSRKDPS